jgi:photosystem II stability/assembly factor-like uncharacterized protein
LFAAEGVLFVIFLLIFHNAFAQWEWQNPRPQGYGLSSLAFNDHRHGIAIGAHGSIILTSDGGETWNLQPRLPDRPMVEVVAFDSTSFVAVSDVASFKSIDNGKTWSIMSYIPGFYPYGRIKVLNDHVGLAYRLYYEGHTLLKTTDGGLTWQPKLSTGYFAVSDIAFSDSVNGFVMTYDSVYRTTDGAESLFAVHDLLQEFKPFSIAYSGKTGYFLSAGLYSPNGNIDYCKLLKSVDNGNTWSMVADTTVPLSRLYFIDSLRGFGVYFNESSSYMYYTKNGGVNWTLLYHSFDPEPVLNIVDSTSVFLIRGAKIFKWNDGEMSWELTTPGVDNYFNAIQFVNDSVGYAESNNYSILKTIDGGETWVPKFISYNKISGIMSFADANNGIVVSYDTIFISHDGAETWKAARIPLNVFEVRKKVVYIDAASVYMLVMCMDAGYTKTWYKVLLSTDTLHTWTEVLLPEGEYYDMMFVNSSTGFLTGGYNTNAPGDGFILRTTDGGKTWSEMEINNETLGVFTKIQMFDSNTGVVEYSNPSVQTKLLPITNGIVLSQPLWTHADDIYSAFNPFPFHFFSHESGFVLYDEKLYRLQSDSVWGLSWSLFDEFPSFYDICFLSPTKGFLFSNNMLIHLSPNASPLSISEDWSSNSPALIKVYPVPASDRLVFRFTGQGEISADLVIVNTQGQRVISVPNANLLSNTDYPINVSDLPAGIYFYRFNTMSGVTSGKLLLSN